MLIDKIEDNVVMIETAHKIGAFEIWAVVFQQPSNLNRTFVFYSGEIGEIDTVTHTVFVPDMVKIDEGYIMDRTGCNQRWAKILTEVIKEMGMKNILKADMF